MGASAASVSRGESHAKAVLHINAIKVPLI